MFLLYQSTQNATKVVARDVSSDEEEKDEEPKSLRTNQKIERPKKLIFTDGYLMSANGRWLSPLELEGYVKIAKFNTDNERDVLLLRDSFGNVHHIPANFQIPLHSLSRSTIVTNIEMYTNKFPEVSKLFKDHLC